MCTEDGTAPADINIMNIMSTHTIMKTATILLIHCVVLVILSVVAAVVCQQKEEGCFDNFNWPIAVTCSACTAVACVALLYVEFGMQHRTGLYN